MVTHSFHVVIQVAVLSSKMLHLRATVLTEKEKAIKVREGWWGRRRVKDQNPKRVFFLWGGGRYIGFLIYSPYEVLRDFPTRDICSLHIDLLIEL
jgi:hypothetical protein